MQVIRSGGIDKRQLALFAETALLILLAFAITATAVALFGSMGLGDEGGSDEVPLEGVRNDSPDYILPESDSRIYSKEELSELSTWDLYLAHNEIYARHGRGFDRDDLAAYFASCPWYDRIYTPEEFDALPSPLNEYEQANSETMAEMRRELGDPNL